MIGSEVVNYNFFKQLKQLDYIEQILLYGSRARNMHHAHSDIDLAIICPEASERDWLLILDIIDEADTLLKIDCVRFDQLKNDNLLKTEIVKDAIVLYKKDIT